MNVHGISARMGNTIYRIVESTPTMVGIVRINQDGEKTFYVPIELFDLYAEQRINALKKALVDRIFGTSSTTGDR